ncbi:MAG: hypothetical protein K0R66_1647 [Gammaproteobacteria bacterium]|jgi:hypothetical protein|nr:hypothetical protein [Gammaproteobacteria bacterium]
MTLNEYFTAYAAAPDTAERSAQAEIELSKFEQECIRKNYVNLKGIKPKDGKPAEGSRPNFIYKLLAFYVRSVTEANQKKEPFSSILSYFRLRAQLGNKEAAPIATIFNTYSEFNALNAELKKLLVAHYRDPIRIERKFMRIKRPVKSDNAADTLAKALKDRVDGKVEQKTPIELNGLPSRSVIIAINKAMKQLQAIGAGNVIRFKIGDTFISYEPRAEHGRGRLHMKYYEAGKEISGQPDWQEIKGFYYAKYGRYGNAAYEAHQNDFQRRKIIHHFPYGNAPSKNIDLPRLLKMLSDKVKPGKTLAQLIHEHFGGSITPFTQADFRSPIDPGDLHFLNAFGFLTQIFEPARYLLDDIHRAVQDEPMSTALAVSKRLWRGGASLLEMFGDCSASFKTDHPYHQYDAKDAPGYGGLLDPASGKGLNRNMDIVRAKIEALEARHRGYVGNAANSARASYNLLAENYGSGDESDSDESCYSFSDENELGSLSKALKESHREAMLRQIDTWEAKKPEGAPAELDSELDELAELAAENNLLLRNAPGDGNCFFHAVIDQLAEHRLNRDRRLNHESLRAMAIDHILNNLGEFTKFIPNPDEFIERMTNDGEWADHEIIHAVALALGVTIRIIGTNGHTEEVNPGQEHTLTLGYYYGLHYGSFRQRPEWVQTSDGVLDATMLMRLMALDDQYRRESQQGNPAP